LFVVDNLDAPEVQKIVAIELLLVVWRKGVQILDHDFRQLFGRRRAASTGIIETMDFGIADFVSSGLAAVAIPIER